MKKRFVLLLSFLLLFFVIYAQENEQKITYSNITEFGFVTASPQGVAFEGTTVNGFTINKIHNIGIGIGIGASSHTTYQTSTAYTPIFVNYRVYFKPEKKFSPHVNLAVGGVLVKDGEGVYSSLTSGFRAGKFSFSSGLSFLGVKRESNMNNNYLPYVAYSYKEEWYYPFGITFKFGFSF